MLFKRDFIKGEVNYGISRCGYRGRHTCFLYAVRSAKKNNSLIKKQKHWLYFSACCSLDGPLCPFFTDANLQTARPNLFMSAAAVIPANDVAAYRSGWQVWHAAPCEKFRTLLPQRTTRYRARRSDRRIIPGLILMPGDYMESGTPFNKGTASGWLNGPARFPFAIHVSPSGCESSSAFCRDLFTAVIRPVSSIANLRIFRFS